jgi:Family of unknown function (DUF5715)
MKGVYLALGAVATIGLSAAALNWLTPGQASLKGGQFSTPAQAFAYAKAHEYAFADSQKELRELKETGKLVRLSKTSQWYSLHGVSHPLVMPITRTFVERLGKEYVGVKCGKLPLTSAVRLTSERPKNGSVFSVHPTGMAVDIRIPEGPKCRSWLGRKLKAIERDRRIDATREKSPPHLHVVVVTITYQAWLKKQKKRQG